MSFVVTTVAADFTLTDLGGQVLTHPAVVDLELSYPIEELKNSETIETGLTGGAITITYNGSSITSLSDIKLVTDGDFEADNISYDNSGSGLAATDVQAAIDEVAAASGATNLGVANKTATTLDVTSDTGSDATLPAATGTEAGLQSASDKTKLDGVEAGATADQTDAEIKTAYENNADTNAFTDAEKTKLSNQSGTNTGDEVSATESVEGIAELATQAEADAGTDDQRIITALKAKNTRGIESFFLTPRGNVGGGPAWADSGFIALHPHRLFEPGGTERTVYMFYALARAKFDNVDPQVSFLVTSTGAPGAGDAVRWQLSCKYKAVGEALGGAADQVLLQTQTLTNLSANTRQSILTFTLDRTLISDQDTIHLNLERLGADAADTYSSDIGVGQSGIILETLKHNP